MLSDGRAAPIDLLVVGGLTLDRFPDGSVAPGGSVVHIARAASPRGLRLGILTAAGGEAEARAAIGELHRLASSVHVTPAHATVTFRHRETPAGRRLWLEAPGGQVRREADAPAWPPARAVLFAPVAGEVGLDLLPAREGAAGVARGALLQGWLRSAEVGEVRPLPLAALKPALLAALGRLDLLVASREDLRAEGRDPVVQLARLRSAVGAAPALIVTDGAAGAWIQAPRRGPERHRPGRTVVGAPTVGAGDVFGAFVLTLGAALPDFAAAMGPASDVVIELLVERGGRAG